MDASLGQVKEDFISLCLLAMFYFITSCLVIKKMDRKLPFKRKKLKDN